MECRWHILLGLGCTNSPKKIGRISYVGSMVKDWIGDQRGGE
jgi:hypothetical protein